MPSLLRPRWCDQFARRVRALFTITRDDVALDDELAFHLEEAIAFHMSRGLSRDAAVAAARREFGAIAPVAEACRDARGTQRWLSVTRDIRAGWRAARRSPTTSLAAVATLALGIGTSTAMFSVVDGVLLRPLPFDAPQQLIRADHFVARGALAVMADHLSTIDAGVFLPDVEYNVMLGDTAERLRGTEVSTSLPRLLGIEMARGRAFLAHEGRDADAAVVIVSHRLWTERLGARSDVVGTALRVDGISRVIVGVLPAGSLLPLPDADVWLPTVEVAANPVELWASSGYALLGRRRDHATVDDVTAELRRLAPLVRDSYPWRMPDEFGATITARPLLDTVVADVRQRVLLLASAVTLLLLVACANVATLVLSRAVVREREFSVRAALGASRGRLVQQLLTESLTVWLVGGLSGLALGWLGLDLFRVWLPPDVPRLQALALDGRAVAAALLVTLATGVGFGLLPARRMARPDVAGVLRAHEGPAGTGGHRQPVLRVLVVAQLVAAVVLVSGVLLTTRSLSALVGVSPGFDASDVVTARLTPDATVCAEPARCQPFFDEVVTRAEALRGVTSVSLASHVPLDGTIAFFAIDVQDHPVAPGAPAFTARQDVVTPAYFESLDIPVVRGRTFTSADVGAAQQVAVVNEAFARHFWPGGDAVGKRLRYVWQEQWRTIVGVVGDVRSSGMASPAPLAFFVPYGQEHSSALHLFVEGARPPDVLAREIRTLVAGISGDVPVSRVQTLSSALDASFGAPAALVRLLAAFGGLVLLLSVVGTYGVLAGSVSARRREFGIRLALGASPTSLVGDVIAEALRLCGVALAIGVPLSWLAASGWRDVLYRTGPYDLLAQVGVFIVMVALALLAAAFPALRAARTPPIEALRD